MSKKNIIKLGITLMTVLLTTTIVIIFYTIVLMPKAITEIKKNTVYIGGLYGKYPSKNHSRSYIEFKDNGTFVLMYDDSRRSQEDYGDDGAGYAQNIICFFGKYKLENGNYLIKPTDGARVVFKDSAAVDKDLISFYKEENYENDPAIVGMILYKTKKGQYILGNPTADKKSFKKNRNYYLMYNKSDIKKLPSSPEEFRKQFKMDKKAEQERLAEEERRTGQSQ